MSYKKTLNIPSTEFPMRASLVDNETKFKEFWSHIDLYSQLSSRKNTVFVLHDGPPYANGDIHLGHALNKILKDFILRYKALRGFSIDYLPGWDTHGLPIENKVEKFSGYANRDPIEKRAECKKYALSQLERQKLQFEKLHLLSDFQNIYRTLDGSFINFELEVFYSLLEQKLLHWDLKPVAWSWSSKTALAESEILYFEEETTSIYFWFPISGSWSTESGVFDEGVRFLVWTTTPYTLEANLALSVNPDLIYVLVQMESGEKYVFLEEKLEEFGANGKVLFSFPGKHLKGASYFNPITQEVRKVLVADFVLSGTGTGIVHTAPGFGLEDYYVCLKEKIEVYVSINADGHFTDNTKFSTINGLFYTQASGLIIGWLNSHGYLYKKELISHSVGHDWRTEKPLLYLASPQWFVNISLLKKRIKGKIHSKVQAYPEWLSKKLEELILGREEWCLSRQRVWGTPIPIIFDEENNPILDLKQVQWTIYLLGKEGIESWFKEDAKYFLHPDLQRKYEHQNLRKSGDILDVWFDSGCSWGVLSGDKVADLYLEGFDQLRGWFNSSSTISIAFRDCLPFKSLLSHGFVLDKDGNKMSKSKGNVVDPLSLISQYGVDVVRLWVGLNNFLEDIRISKESLENAVSIYRKIRNTVFRYSLSVLPASFSVNYEILDHLNGEENKYIYQLFRETWIQIEQNLENYLFFKALKLSLNFLNTYSSWYLEICKDILYCNKSDSPEYLEIINVIGEVFEKYLFLYSIFIPQTAEEAWTHYSPGKSSIFLQNWKKLSDVGYPIDKSFWEKFWKLKDQIYSEIELLKGKGQLSGPLEAKVTLTSDLYMENLEKFLNVGEAVLGSEFNVEKCELPLCLRCRRHKNKLSIESLCDRCVNSLHA